MPFRSNLRFAFRQAPAPRQADEPGQTPAQEKVPQCPHCKVDMLWYESHLVRENGRQKIIHSFHCPNCVAIAQIEEPWKFLRLWVSN